MGKRKKKSATPSVDVIIDPIAEMATSVAEVGLVRHSPIDASLYNAPPNESEMEQTIAKLSADDPQPTPDSEFDAVIASQPENKVDEIVFATAAAFDSRAAFEESKDAGNANIQRTLKKARAQMITKRAARVMLATNISPDVINRSIHQGSCYNVYAIGKLADLVFGLTGGVVSNAINRAITKSLFQFRAGGAQFTGEMAKAAASDKVRTIDPSVRRFLVSHTVSASTAPTQASSTMQALETLGVVKRSGSSRNPNFDLTENPVVKKLESLFAAAA